MNELQAAFRSEFASASGGLDHIGTGELDRGPQVSRASHLHERRVLRHDDRRLDPEQCSVVSHALGMIPGRHRDNSATVGDPEKPVSGAATFEGTRVLQVLKLQKDFGTADL